MSSLQRYRFPGEIPVPKKCREPKQCRPYITIKVCPPTPYIKDTECRPNIFDRAIVHYVPEALKCQYNAKFLLETFSGMVLLPRNLDRFCGYDFKDGEVVAVEAEIMQCEKQVETCEPVCKPVCKPKCCKTKCCETKGCETKGCETKCCETKGCETTCENECVEQITTTTTTVTDVVCGATAVKIFRILRVWKFDKKSVTGVVLPSVDSNGISYHLIQETVDLATGVPYAYLVENVLNTQTYVINYELFNIMGVNDPQQVMRNLEGKTITAQYVDYGQETADRIGIPIVVFDYVVLV